MQGSPREVFKGSSKTTLPRLEEKVEDRWTKLEEIVRRVVKEELAAAGKGKAKLGFENGRWTGVTEEQMTAWREAYGMVDVDAELKKAAAWIVSNPHMAPKSQLGRFLNTWFARTQNTASIRSIPSRTDSLPGPGKKLCSYCDTVASARFGNIWACTGHGQDALDGKPIPMMKNPVIAKNVAGDR